MPPTNHVGTELVKDLARMVGEHGLKSSASHATRSKPRTRLVQKVGAPAEFNPSLRPHWGPTVERSNEDHRRDSSPNQVTQRT